MQQYLSKEEIRQWRSSLEKITLEEFAARLGKVINEEKETRDIVDIVLEKDPLLVHESYKVKTEKITSIAQKALIRERDITIVKPVVKNSDSQVSVKRETIKEVLTGASEKKLEIKKERKAPRSQQVVKEVKKAPVEIKVETSAEGLNVSFKKPLTEREQLVFNHFVANKNSIVYAKDLAKLLDLPRDYVYKYIKNLRNKIIGDTLENASNGGYVLKV